MIISDKQLDILQELINIGVGKAASLFNQIIDAHINLKVPYIKFLSSSELIDQNYGEETQSIVQMSFKGLIGGTISLLLSPESAKVLVSVLTEEDVDSVDFDSIHGSTLTEIGNIILNGVMGTLANLLQEHLSYNVPIYSESKTEWLFKEIEVKNTIILVVGARFEVDEYSIEGEILIIIELASFNKLIEAIDNL